MELMNEEGSEDARVMMSEEDKLPIKRGSNDPVTRGNRLPHRWSLHGSAVASINDRRLAVPTPQASVQMCV
jgi:hypothetical protein